MKLIQEVITPTLKVKGAIYEFETGFKVFHEKESLTMAERLDLITHCAEITAKIQGVSMELQLKASTL